MLSKAKIKLVQSLKEKKHRKETGLFVVEGNKNVAELLRSKIQVKTLFATHEWLTAEYKTVHDDIEIIETEQDEMKKISFGTSPRQAVALALIPENNKNITFGNHTFIIALDTIQDPGNLGAIIRTADWYGINHIICSPGCADVFSPKVIQSTMGSFTRVMVTEMPLEDLFKKKQDIPVYGAVLNGQNLYESKIQHGILLIGNEGSGIHPDLLKYITNPITIPRTGEAESLNAAIATAIICDNRSRLLPK